MAVSRELAHIGLLEVRYHWYQLHYYPDHLSAICNILQWNRNCRRLGLQPLEVALTGIVIGGGPFTVALHPCEIVGSWTCLPVYVSVTCVVDPYFLLGYRTIEI